MKSAVLMLSEAINHVRPGNGSLMQHNYKINVDLLYSYSSVENCLAKGNV